METVQAAPLPDGIPELAIVGGDLALDFANTVDDPLGPRRFDHLADYRALLVWAQRVGLLTSGLPLLDLAAEQPPEAAAVVRRAAQLRDALNLIFGQVIDGVPTDEGWRQLRPFVVEAIDRADLVDATPAWELAELRSPLWPVAHQAYVLLTGPDLPRVKRCAACPWLFVDGSRNGSRRWCSMEICGTSQKISRYVARRAERRSR
ncbi:protein of unknown function DUF1470 [Kribbella flavida DSM 17836]|uniref:Zinc finger CGNR domain-containing protein n=1 Tax=Kribbella flavida (strain DSM 17836 / JCM 10339 / NBRC 14399) TaxID=479435 RepID=D2Q423_KRIFD|nr:CGNR zinc finger domain-containing protein [Kribbella flavida]ADB30337.1 protein of unknown function DUF1470 [Kribbella flavida DSM 17836]